jgi:hypothetical protein
MTMALSRDALGHALFRNGTKLESVPGLREDVLVGQIITYLTEWDMTQFFGRVHEAIAAWEKENGKGFPTDYAWVDIHPYALRVYWRSWPADRFMTDQSLTRMGPMKVLGVELREDNQMHRTAWRLMLTGRMLTNGEVLEVL